MVCLVNNRVFQLNSQHHATFYYRDHLYLSLYKDTTYLLWDYWDLDVDKMSLPLHLPLLSLEGMGHWGRELSDSSVAGLEWLCLLEQ